MKALRHSRQSSQGQAMVEFALAIGLFLLVIGGLIQFAMILWSQNTVNQIARDTARWAVTQSVSPCTANSGAVASTANALAQRWSLMGHGSWTSASSDLSAVPPSGVGVRWDVVDPPGGMQVFDTDCPPSDNRIAWVVQVRINHNVPIFMPGLQFIASGCGAPGFCISSTTELRMEPKRPQ